MKWIRHKVSTFLSALLEDKRKGTIDGEGFGNNLMTYNNVLSYSIASGVCNGTRLFDYPSARWVIEGKILTGLAPIMSPLESQCFSLSSLVRRSINLHGSVPYAWHVDGTSPIWFACGLWPDELLEARLSPGLAQVMKNPIQFSLCDDGQ